VISNQTRFSLTLLTRLLPLHGRVGAGKSTTVLKEFLPVFFTAFECLLAIGRARHPATCLSSPKWYSNSTKGLNPASVKISNHNDTDSALVSELSKSDKLG
jgi:hypothetical protein